jgi:hypothetical protein
MPPSTRFRAAAAVAAALTLVIATAPSVAASPARGTQSAVNSAKHSNTWIALHPDRQLSHSELQQLFRYTDLKENQVWNGQSYARDETFTESESMGNSHEKLRYDGSTGQISVSGCYTHGPCAYFDAKHYYQNEEGSWWRYKITSAVAKRNLAPGDLDSTWTLQAGEWDPRGDAHWHLYRHTSNGEDQYRDVLFTPRGSLVADQLSADGGTYSWGLKFKFKYSKIKKISIPASIMGKAQRA